MKINTKDIANKLLSVEEISRLLFQLNNEGIFQDLKGKEDNKDLQSSTALAKYIHKQIELWLNKLSKNNGEIYTLTQSNKVKYIPRFFFNELNSSINSNSSLEELQYKQYPSLEELKKEENIVNASGVNFLVGCGYSPLLTEGSGVGLAHPETSRTYIVKTTLSCSIALPNIRAGGEFNIGEYIKEYIQLINQQPVVLGQPLVNVKSLFNPKIIDCYLYWDKINPGYVYDYQISFRNNQVVIKLYCYIITTNNNEKCRGFGKYRMNPFLHSISIYDPTLPYPDNILFNPNLPLYNEQGELNQLEVVISPEESKVSNYIVGLISHYKEEGVYWDGNTGDWLKETELREDLEYLTKRVTVERKELSPRVYQALKQLYEFDENFEFLDNFTIRHHNIPFYMGIQTEIIEVPLTNSFMGKTSLFLEQLAYLGTEYPHLFTILTNNILTNSYNIESLLQPFQVYQYIDKELPFYLERKNINESFDINQVLPPSFQQLQTKSFIILNTCQVFYCLKGRDSVNISLPKSENGKEIASNVVKSLSFFEYGISVDSLTTIVEKVKANKYLNQEGFLFMSIRQLPSKDYQQDLVVVYLPIEAYLKYACNGNPRNFLLLEEIFNFLSYPLEDRNDTWEQEFHNSLKRLKGALETMMSTANSLYAKLAKTSSLAITARVGTSNWDIIKEDEVHIHPTTIEYYGLKPAYKVNHEIKPNASNIIANNIQGNNESPYIISWTLLNKKKSRLYTYPDISRIKYEYDNLLFSRVPVPGINKLRVVANELVPIGVLQLLSHVQHEGNEGDADGDSASAVITRYNPLKEELRVVKPKGIRTNPLKDNMSD